MKPGITTRTLPLIALALLALTACDTNGDRNQVELPPPTNPTTVTLSVHGYDGAATTVTAHLNDQGGRASGRTIGEGHINNDGTLKLTLDTPPNNELEDLATLFTPDAKLAPAGARYASVHLIRTHASPAGRIGAGSRHEAATRDHLTTGDQIGHFLYVNQDTRVTDQLTTQHGPLTIDLPLAAGWNYLTSTITNTEPNLQLAPLLAATTDLPWRYDPDPINTHTPITRPVINYASETGTVQLQAHNSSGPETEEYDLGAGNIKNGQLTITLPKPPTAALFPPSALGYETSDPDLTITLLTAQLPDGRTLELANTDPQKALEEFREGDAIARLVYADRDATLTLTPEAREALGATALIELARGWNVLTTQVTAVHEHAMEQHHAAGELTGLSWYALGAAE